MRSFTGRVPSDVHRLGAQRHGHLDLALVTFQDAELLKQAGEADVRGGFVDDQPHGPFLRMGAHVDDRVLEPRISDPRHGYEELAVVEPVRTHESGLPCGCRSIS